MHREPRQSLSAVAVWKVPFVAMISWAKILSMPFWAEASQEMRLSRNAPLMDAISLIAATM
jgi:hypothetical protein